MKVLPYVSAAACLAALVMTTTCAPANARHLKRHHHLRVVAQVPVSAASRERDPYGFYFNGYKVSRDPDPNVRQELIRDYLAIYRW
jgi:hypothetical protein